MRNTGLEEAQAGIKIAGRNINNLRYADDTTLMAEREEELKSLLMKVKEESEKVGFPLRLRPAGRTSTHTGNYNEGVGLNPTDSLCYRKQKLSGAGKGA